MLSALVLAQLISIHVNGAAYVNGPPGECAPQEEGTLSNIWERAKSPKAKRYCEVIASAAAKLAAGAMYDEVLVLLDEADRLIPNKGTTLALRGRALVATGRFADGRRALEDASKRGPRALDDPFALYAYARALSRTGAADRAISTFRALLPRASLLAPSERVAAYVEAGMLAMVTGPNGLDEAIANFREAARGGQDVGESIAIAALALALDRTGDKADRNEAQGLLASHKFPSFRASIESPRVDDLLGPSAKQEAIALRAFVLEPIDPALARKRWDQYIESAGAWLEHARTRGKRPVDRARDLAGERAGGR